MRLIDVDALGIGKCNPDVFNDKSYANGWNSAIEMLQNAPIVDDVAKIRHGHWLIKTIRGDKRTVCSECLSETGTCYEENYCPNCGAKMDEEVNE